jgi:hypothetical protein
LKRIADASEVIHGRARQASANMEIKLLKRTRFVRRTDVPQVPRRTTFGEVARVFDECVPAFGLHIFTYCTEMPTRSRWLYPAIVHLVQFLKLVQARRNSWDLGWHHLSWSGGTGDAEHRDR